MTSPDLLTAFEICPRKAFYAPWSRQRQKPIEILTQVLNRVLRAQDAQPDPTYGDLAGSTLLELASSPGIDSEAAYIYGQAMNLAALSDLLATTLRKEGDRPWIQPDTVQNWVSDCLISPEGNKLRRIVIVSHWNNERHDSECRSWFTLGEMAYYGLPMQMVVLVIGHERYGKRHSHWTKALQHSIGHTNIRFKKRTSQPSGNRGMPASAGFTDTWKEIWREDHDEIPRETWLRTMQRDDVLKELCFRIDVPALTPEQCKHMRDMAQRKLDQIDAMEEKPLPNFSQCDWPVKCIFRQCCHQIPEVSPSEKKGYRYSPLLQLSPRQSCCSR